MKTSIGPLQAGSCVEVQWVKGEGADQQFYSAVVTAVSIHAWESPWFGVDICYLPQENGWTETLRVSDFEQGRVRLAQDE